MKPTPKAFISEIIVFVIVFAARLLQLSSRNARRKLSEGMRTNTSRSGLMDLLGFVCDCSPNNPRASQAVFENIVVHDTFVPQPLQISQLGVESPAQPPIASWTAHGFIGGDHPMQKGQAYAHIITCIFDSTRGNVDPCTPEF